LQPTTCAIQLWFGVQIHVKTGYPNYPKDYQTATGYTVRSVPSPNQRSHENGTNDNLLLSIHMTQAELQRHKTIWEEERHVAPLWMTTLVSQPPTCRVYVCVRFLQTILHEEEELHGRYQWLDDPAGMKIGDILSTLYDTIWWPEVKIYEGHRSLDNYVNVSPSLGKDFEPPTKEKATLKE
jgi:hypothetical protein